MDYLLIIIASYLVGSIPNGLIVGKLMRGVDLRQFGSKNIGATNAYRVLGPWPAFWVFLTDALKGIVGVLLGQLLSGTALAQLAGGMAAIAGHNWSIYLKFKGGRGVATSLGVIAVITPQATLIVFIVWMLIVYFTRYVSLASIVAAALAPVCIWLLGGQQEFFYFAVVAALFVIIRHRPNVERLLKGEEPKIKAAGSTKDHEDNIKEK
ncbi:MAG TPA: glycerol-3-phosphate 1-O-acyltransferase PlsY [Methylomusa anaerophila]|uniref:Glycerol-3-phosphate acyltransferase n=1 Tax=Methylomusa anaerophila TaxID=1930071 RepID=A0A348API2_9FIRM|nr:glycerol-3-phosphate 1-O-acyltransferase PlsY [Methylomusa anaerophila]BBB92980.1 glycerol-3-phosphate acyltransferase [Methylomusa anaerophila]HML87186.1 glycerol-3-phosphate 1-O-acyltransferase PlsY [Methylomusa anaerophila]